MKFLMSLSFLLMSMSAFAVPNYQCKQMISRSPVDPRIGALRVTVENIRDITDEVNFSSNYDAVYLTKITISRILAGRSVPVKTFQAVATKYDVQFDVWAVNDQGVKIYIYMDELDEAGITFTDSAGKKTEISLDCN